MRGELIKEFVLVEPLGKGGMGEVWAAEQQRIKTRVAIKLLRPDISSDEVHVRRFFNEAIAVSKIHHAGIPKIFDVGFQNGRAYLIMELLAGESLAARRKRLGRLPLPQIVDIARQTASVLDATHAAGIVHRDLKPDNIFIVPDREQPRGERVKILDFGIAKLGMHDDGTALTATSGTMGTPAYMAPEQWNSTATADGRADVYSLGCALFEIACGRPPFVAATMGAACTMHLHDPPPRMRSLAPRLPAALDELVDRMLAKDPAARPTLAQIEEGLEGVETDAAPDEDMLAETMAPVLANAETVGTLGSARSTDEPAPPAQPIRSTQPAHDTTLGAAAGSRAISVDSVSVPPRRRRWLVALVAVLLLGAGGAWFATRSKRALRKPELAYKTIDDYIVNPTISIAGAERNTELWSSALHSLDTALEQPDAPDHWRAMREIVRGQLAITERKLDDATTAFHEAARIDPTWAVPPYCESLAKSARHDTTNALQLARKARDLAPTWWRAAVATARAYSAAQELDDAITAYRVALPLAPDQPLLLAEIALVYHARYLDDEAHKMAERAVAATHGSHDPLVHISLLRAELALERGDAKAAIDETDSAIAAVPRHGAILLARADAYALLGDRDAALDLYKRALQSNVANAGAPEARIIAARATVETGTLPPPRAAQPGTPTGRSRPYVAGLDLDLITSSASRH